MPWYHLFSNDVGKWVALGVFIVTYGLVLWRKFNIAFLPLGASLILILLGLTNPADAFLGYINWDVLALYAGYGMLANSFKDSGLPSLIVNRALVRVNKEKYALLFLCALAMGLSCFMENPIVVIILAPIAIESKALATDGALLRLYDILPGMRYTLQEIDSGHWHVVVLQQDLDRTWRVADKFCTDARKFHKTILVSCMLHNYSIHIDCCTACLLLMSSLLNRTNPKSSHPVHRHLRLSICSYWSIDLDYHSIFVQFRSFRMNFQYLPIPQHHIG